MILSEYIECEAVMKTAKDGNHSDFGRSMADLTSLREVLEDTPAADVVEVIRCKDCKHLVFSDCYGECKRNYLGIVRPDDYCSKGQRKDDERMEKTTL